MWTSSKWSASAKLISPGRSSSEITWCGCIVPCSASTSLISWSTSVPGALVAGVRSRRRFRRCRPRRRSSARRRCRWSVRMLWPHFSELIRSVKPFERGTPAARGRGGRSCPFRCLRGRIGRCRGFVGEDALLQRFLGEQQDAGAAEPCVERVLALGAVDRRGFEQLPAVEDRLRVDPRGALAGRADREVDVWVDARLFLGDVGEDGAGDHLRADLDRPFRGRLFGGFGSAFACDFCSLAVPPGGRGGAQTRGRMFLAFDRDRFSLPVGVTTVRWLWTSLPSSGVGVAVAVGVFEDDVVAELARVAHLADDAVVDGDDREPFLAKMLIPRRVGEEEMTSAALPAILRSSGVEFFSAARAESSSE